MLLSLLQSRWTASEHAPTCIAFLEWYDLFGSTLSHLLSNYVADVASAEQAEETARAEWEGAAYAVRAAARAAPLCYE